MKKKKQKTLSCRFCKRKNTREALTRFFAKNFIFENIEEITNHYMAQKYLKKITNCNTYLVCKKCFYLLIRYQYYIKHCILIKKTEEQVTYHKYYGCKDEASWHMNH